MKESREMLRQRFQAQTDIEVDPQPGDWKRYAEWLEKLSIKELNSELVKENEMLRNKIQEAIDVLEQGITGAGTRRREERFSKYCQHISRRCETSRLPGQDALPE